MNYKSEHLRGAPLAVIIILISSIHHKPTLIEDNPESRIIHAKELLGTTYEISVAKRSESLAKFGDTIHSAVKRALPKKWKSRSQIITKAVLEQSLKYNWDPMFLLAVIRNESGFNLRAVGTVGEIGLMQVRPESARWISQIEKIKYKGKKSLFNPLVNIQIGSALLDHAKRSFGTNGYLYLSAYNMGVFGVEKNLKKNRWPKTYATKVLDHYLDFYSKINRERVIASNNENGA